MGFGIFIQGPLGLIRKDLCDSILSDRHGTACNRAFASKEPASRTKAMIAEPSAKSFSMKLLYLIPSHSINKVQHV
jgi:hypothetical protein